MFPTIQSARRATVPNLFFALNQISGIMPTPLMNHIVLMWTQLGIAFSALLPLVNPLGSALVFYGLVGAAPPEIYRRLARKIAINTVIFLLVIEIGGAALLSFFGVSLPIVELAGGLVLAAMGWSLLNQQGATAHQQEKQDQAPPANTQALFQQTFYPLTFPVTAGPGCIVIMLTLSAHAGTHGLTSNLLAHLGILIAVIVLCVLVYFAYAYAPLITRKISPQTAQGVVRVIAFLLLCIGVQIAWNGVSALVLTLAKHH
jgi:multiple antibiotic resistance protein